HITDYLHYIEKHKKYGILIYLTVYTICVWLFLPGSIISIAAGFLFKPPILAGAIIIIGDIFGALGTFIFGRYIFSDWVKAQIEKRPVFTALNNVITEEGWKIVVMLRLTPIPFNLISYFFSVSSIDVSYQLALNHELSLKPFQLFTFLWATAVGVLPGTFNAVWIGSLVKSLSGLDNPNLKNKDIVIITMNVIFVVCCVVALSIFGKRSLRKAMLKLKASKESTNNNAPLISTESIPDEEANHPLVEEEPLTIPETGRFTRAERITLFIIGIVAFLNLAISVPLYFYFRAHEPDSGSIK
ncbi:9298_t:CDS:2, partial [Acaulospora morrowiae]